MRQEHKATTLADAKVLGHETHELVQADQMHVRALMVAVMKMVPRRPNQLLRGAVIQHPRTAQHSCQCAKPGQLAGERASRAGGRDGRRERQRSVREATGWCWRPRLLLPMCRDRIGAPGG
jgi:hypothetical protein